jgi:hypothetical protein
MRTAMIVAVVISLAAPAQAGVGSKAAGELAEFVMKKFCKEAAREGAEKLAGRIMQAAGRHGDDVLEAIRKVGPKAISLADDAGADAPRVVRLLSHFGDDGARILAQPRGLVLISRLGDDAAEVLIKHKGVAGPLLESAGMPAVKAFKAIGPQNGRRLAMMADELTAIGRTPELLDVIARHGDMAMDFIWRHKALLASGATLAAFLRDPEPFLSGAADLTQAVTENLVKPAAQAATDAAVVAGKAIQPTVMAATDAAREFVLWVAGGLLVALVTMGAVARLAAINGDLGNLVFRTGLRRAGGRIAGAFRKK